MVKGLHWDGRTVHYVAKSHPLSSPGNDVICAIGTRRTLIFGKLRPWAIV